MNSAIPNRDRWLALGILAAVLALAYLVLVHPWWTTPMLELNDQIETMQQRDLRARMELKQSTVVRQQLQTLRTTSARSPGFMLERTPELASSALVQRLETAVLEASPGNRSCAISNRSPLNDPRPERFPRVVVKVRLRCGSGELAKVLHSLESGSPRLFVDNLNIFVQRYYIAAGRGSPNRGLDVSFDLYGYIQPLPGAAANAR